MSLVAPIMMGLSAVSSFAGGIMQGNAQKKSLEYNAKMAEQNAAMQTAQAEENASRTRRQVQKVLASQKTVYGKAGITGPTMADVASDTLVEGEIEALDQLYQGKVAAYNSMQQSTLYRAQAKSAQQAGYTSAIGGLLQGGARAFSAYNQMNPRIPDSRTFRADTTLRSGAYV